MQRFQLSNIFAYSRSYKNLNGGVYMDASVDLTGGISEFFPLRELSDEEVFRKVNFARENGAFMGSTPIVCIVMQLHAYLSSAVKLMPSPVLGS